MADSDSDREELNYLLRQSSSQLRFINGVFKEVLAKAENSGETTGKYVRELIKCIIIVSFISPEKLFSESYCSVDYFLFCLCFQAEMEATCDENIGSLQLVLTNVEETENLPFEVDVKSYGSRFPTELLLSAKLVYKTKF